MRLRNLCTRQGESHDWRRAILVVGYGRVCERCDTWQTCTREQWERLPRSVFERVQPANPADQR